MNDPEGIRFSNEQIRPLCERMRNMYWEFKALVPYWADTISGLIENNPADLIDDGREEVTQLTGEDVYNVISEMGQYIAAIEEAGVLSTITKPCVRPLVSN